MSYENELICSVEAEQAVLCCFIKYPHCYHENADKLICDDFINETHQIIFTLLGEALSKNKPHDVCDITIHIASKRMVEADYLSHLISISCSQSNLEAYIEIVRDRAVRRGLLGAFSKSQTLVKDTSQKISYVCDEIETEIHMLQRQVGEKKTSLRDLVSRYCEKIEAAASSSASEMIGIPTGFYGVDKLTQGLRKGNLIIIAGRPGMGKTSLAMNMVEHAVFAQKKCTMFFSLEMSGDELTERLYSSQSGITQRKLNSGKLNPHEWDRFAHATAKITNANDIFSIADVPSLTPSLLRSMVRRQFSMNPPALIVVDYLQLMGLEKKVYNKTEEITEISRELKKLAKEFEVPVLALSQLNRESEKRTGSTPQLADLRGSGSIEQDADVVMFVHRDEIANPNSNREGEADVFIVKNRHGATGEVKLTFNGSTTQFLNREGYPVDDYCKNY